MDLGPQAAGPFSVAALMRPLFRRTDRNPCPTWTFPIRMNDDFRRVIMDNDRVEGSMKNIKGGIKEGVGKAVGDSKMQTEGKLDKAEGKIQNTIGGIKDSFRKDRE
jgi:uncharacterized protein YjbJ (UPF0337 family)